MTTKTPPEKPRQLRPLAKGDVEYWKEAKEVEELSKRAGYKWYRGMHPDETLPLLREVFSDVIKLRGGSL